MGKIYTGYFNKAKSLDRDKYFFISIARSTPKWFKVDDKILVLCPDWAIIEKWKNSNQDDKAWGEYKQQYIRGVHMTRSTIVNTPYFVIIATKLVEISKETGKDIVLLCHEGPKAYQFEKEFCHRFIVRDELNNCGLDIQEMR